MQWIFKIIIALLLLFTACGPQADTANNNPIVDSGLQKPDKVADDSDVIDTINALIDATYDNPQQVILQPDSFINRLQVLPSSVLGKQSYTLLLLNIGYVLREHGLVLPSIRFYERALDYHTKHHLKEPDFVLYIAKPLANLYTRIDDIGKSVSLHEKAIQIALQNGQLAYLPALYNNLAIAYQQNGQFDRVVKISQKGLSSINGKSIYSALLYNNLTNAYMGLYKIDSASYFNQKALNLFQSYQPEGDTVVWLSGALKLESDIAKAKNNFSGAIQSLNRAINLTNSTFSNTNQRVKAKYHVARGQLTMDRQPQAALADFKAAIQLLDSDAESVYVPDYTFTEALHGLAKIYAALNKDSALYYYARTIENDYLTQELIVSKASNYKNSKWNRKILSEYVALLGKAYQKAHNEEVKQSLVLRLFWAIEMSKGRQVLREINRSRQWADENRTKEDQLRRKLKALYLQLVSARDTNATVRLQKKIADINFKFQMSEQYFEQTFRRIKYEKFKQFLLKKSKSKTLVSYLIQKDGTSYVVCISNAKATVNSIGRNQFQKLDISRFITDYFGDTPYRYENNPDLYNTQAQKITQSFLPFISSSKRTIVASPDGPLFKLPLDALVADGKFIVEAYTLSYTYSFILNFLHQSKQTYISDVLFFGKSKYSGNFSNLNFVETEKKLIANHFRGATFEGKRASIQSFLSHLHQKDILHLATHAVSDPKPYIVFEKPLTLNNLSIVDMQSPLVVLSSCESADGKLIKAEGLESLNKAFISKGVRGVIAAQWPVDDQSIARLMGLFYQALYQLQRPAQALTSAKRRFLKEKGTVYKNPWYWASMNYMGIETHIQIKKKVPIWVWGIPVVFIAFAFYLYRRKKRRKQ